MTAKKAAAPKPRKAAPAQAEPKKAPKRGNLRVDQPRMFDAGQRARASGIPKDQAPVFFNDAERKAWHEGYGE